MDKRTSIPSKFQYFCCCFRCRCHPNQTSFTMTIRIKLIEHVWDEEKKKWNEKKKGESQMPRQQRPEHITFNHIEIHENKVNLIRLWLYERVLFRMCSNYQFFVISSGFFFIACITNYWLTDFVYVECIHLKASAHWQEKKRSYSRIADT